MLLIFLIILITIKFDPIKTSSLDYNCIGGGRRGMTTTQCTQDRTVLPSIVYECPSSNTNPLQEAEGCEQDTSGDYWCCPEYCADGITMIYYKQITNPAGQTLGPTPTCTGAGICPTNSSQQCDQPNPVDGRWFCCPIANSLPSGRITISPIGRSGCEDIGGEDCLLKDYLCNNTLYFDLMTWQCPLTCNRCPADNSQPTRPPNIANPALPNQNCKDMLDCPTWKKNGFCQNAFYSMDTKATMCPISCQLGCALEEQFLNLMNFRQLTGRRIWWCPGGQGYLAYCPQPIDPDGYNFCCTYYHLGVDKPSCCLFPLHTGVLIALFLGFGIFLLLFLFFTCWFCPFCPLANGLIQN